jgi:hypothetical protein
MGLPRDALHHLLWGLALAVGFIIVAIVVYTLLLSL